MVVTTLHLLRHGEVHNPTGVLYGRLPGYGLSERGRQMAERIASHVAGRDITAVIASPLQRAQETAAPIAAALGLEITTDPRLLEAENQFEGLTFGIGDGSLRHPRFWPLLRNPFRPSWGEPYRQQADRVLAAIDEKIAGKEVVASAHHEDEPGGGQVIDLMEALRASLGKRASSSATGAAPAAAVTGAAPAAASSGAAPAAAAGTSRAAKVSDIGNGMQRKAAKRAPASAPAAEPVAEPAAAPTRSRARK